MLLAIFPNWLLVSLAFPFLCRCLALNFLRWLFGRLLSVDFLWLRTVDIALLFVIFCFHIDLLVAFLFTSALLEISGEQASENKLALGGFLIAEQKLVQLLDRHRGSIHVDSHFGLRLVTLELAGGFTVLLGEAHRFADG